MTSANTGIGPMAAIAFLFSLMALGSVFYAVSLAAVATGREQAVGVDVARLEETAETLRERRSSLETALAAARARLGEFETERERLGTVEENDDADRSLKLLQVLRDTLSEELAALKSRRAELEDRQLELAELEERVAEMQRERQDVEAEIARLETELAATEGEIDTVKREIEDTDRVHAEALVPGGSRRPAVFVECDAKGAWLMPERRMLEPTVPREARRLFMEHVRKTGYVVFLIRPDGFTAFERYRDFVETYNDTSTVPIDYGYEPLDADWRLVYPKVEARQGAGGG